MKTGNDSDAKNTKKQEKLDDPSLFVQNNSEKFDSKLAQINTFSYETGNHKRTRKFSVNTKEGGKACISSDLKLTDKRERAVCCYSNEGV